MVKKIVEVQRMEVEFYKGHSMGSEYVVVDNRTGRYDTPLRDKKFCARIVDHHYGVGKGLTTSFLTRKPLKFIKRLSNGEGRQGSDGRYGVRFIDHRGDDGFYGGSNTATAAGIAKALGIFENNAWKITNRNTDYDIQYDGEEDRFWFQFRNYPLNGIKPFDDGYLINVNYPHLVHLVDDVKSIDVATIGPNIQKTAQIEKPSFSVTFYERTEKDDVYNARTCSGTNNEEIRFCGSGTVAVALVDKHLRLKEAEKMIENPTEEIRNVKVNYPGGTVYGAYALDEDLQFSNVKLGMPATCVFKGQIPYTGEEKTSVNGQA